MGITEVYPGAQVNTEINNFKDFAEFLFNQEPAPAANSMIVDIDFEDQSTPTHFLYDLFGYGYRKKFAEVPATELCERHFKIIREYIRAIGYETILHGYTKDDEVGEIKDIQISFTLYRLS
jgi:hypothetical protein